MLRKLSPIQIITAGYLVVIFIGAFLLSTSLVTVRGASLHFVDALFTATSAVSVTGLVVVDTMARFNTFGQFIILVLIQIGGLGYMTFASLFLLILRKNFSLRNRIAMQESVSMGDINGIKEHVLNILKMVFVIEGVSALLFFAIFHSNISFFDSCFQVISAFCNAGFSTIDFSLWQSNIIFNLIITTLIIVGGIGYFVIDDILKTPKQLSFHSKLVLVTTGFLIIGGTLLFFFAEHISLLAAYFTSITTRTAGFATVDVAAFQPASILGIIVLMFIGASPGGTGGGIKTVTMAILLITGVAYVRGKEKGVAFKRSVKPVVFRKSFLIFFFTLLFIYIATLLISFFEPFTLTQILFEVTSAISTVGLSMGITAKLSLVSKVFIIVLMIIGRIGVFLITNMLFRRDTDGVNYPEEKVLI